MSTPLATFTTFQLYGSVVSLGNGGDDEYLFPIASLRAVSVDWNRHSGVLTFELSHGSNVSVSFIENDAGQECSDAISDLFAAWRAGEEVHAS